MDTGNPNLCCRERDAAEPPELEVVIEIPRGSFLKRGSSGRIDFVSPLPCPFNYGSAPAWLGLDLQDAAGKEATGLSQRNQYLLALAKEKCGPQTQVASFPATSPEPAISPLASNSEIQSTLTLASH